MPKLGTPEFKLWWAGFIAGIVTRRVGSYPDIVYVPLVVLEQALKELRFECSPTAGDLAIFVEAHQVKP